MEYIKSLDGLRAVAVILVILRHWNYPLLNLELGWIGVNIFFVLSGFLISSILLKDKERLSLGPFMKLFYLKRALRIFPIYYIYLIVVGLCLWIVANHSGTGLFTKSFEIFKNNCLLLFSYTYNFDAWLQLQGFTTPATSKFFDHLWSLSVEEQFYLIFPLIIFFTTRKQLKKLVLFILIAAPFLRIVVGEWFKINTGQEALVGLVLYKSTVFQLDALATGILLSLIPIRKIQLKEWQIASGLGVLIAGLLFIVNLLKHYGISINYSTFSFQLINIQIQYDTNTFLDYYYSFSLVLINLLAALIIIACVKGMRSFNFLSNNLLVSIGKISYGVYIFHYGIYFILYKLVEFTIGHDIISTYWYLEGVIFIGYFLVVIMVAKLSYQYIELPFLRKKKKLEKHI